MGTPTGPFARPTEARPRERVLRALSRKRDVSPANEARDEPGSALARALLRTKRWRRAERKREFMRISRAGARKHALPRLHLRRHLRLRCHEGAHHALSP